MKPSAIVGLILALTAAGPAAAHQIWLERDASGIRLHYGELVLNLREISPGLLDNIEPTVTVAGKPLKAERKDQSFAVTGTVGAGDSIVAEDTRFPIATGTYRGKPSRSIYYPAARHIPDRAAREATLTLDVVPVAAADTYKVVFKGQPLAGATVTAASASGWARSFTTSADGQVQIPLPWQGLYVFEVLHNDRTPGQRGAEAYDVVNYVTSLSYVHPTGAAAPATPPAAPPNK